MNIIAELLNLHEGMWVVKNKDGKEKRFKDENSEAAQAWKRSSSAPKKARSKSFEKSDRPKKPTATELDTIYRKADDAIGNSFPDGDPFDQLSGWLRKNGYDMDHVDAAFKKHQKMGYYDYLASYWDEFARDQVADAKNELKRGGKPQHSSFYDVEDDKVVPRDNPWK